MRWLYRTLFLLFLLLMTAQPQTARADEEAQAQLDQLVAPVALYPDDLLGQILMASTYPLEVVEAERWRTGNPGLSDGALAAAIEEKDWDPSVKSLTQVPSVLAMMDDNLEWTEKLGEAFIADQGSVMDAVQRLRGRAEEAGRLQSGPQLSVSQDDGIIDIAPAQPDMVYIPYYNPAVVFAPWPYPAYAPYYFRPPFYSQNYGTTFYIFGPPIIVIDWVWHLNRCDWHHHRIRIDDHTWRRLNHDEPPRMSGVWTHDPVHRHEVPYTNPTVRARFHPVSTETRRENRGYIAPAQLSPQMRPLSTQPRTFSGSAWQDQLGGHAPRDDLQNKKQEHRNRFEQPSVAAPQAPVAPAVESPTAPTATEPAPETPHERHGFNRNDATDNADNGHNRHHGGWSNPVMPPRQESQPQAVETAPPVEAVQPDMSTTQPAETRTAPLFESFGPGREVRRAHEQGGGHASHGNSLPHGAVPMPAVHAPVAPTVTAPAPVTHGQMPDKKFGRANNGER